MALSFLLVLGGLLVLVLGAELLVRGASAIALAWGVAPLVIGLTVVAFGTSAPEIAVSVRAALAGQGDIAVGNVVGSNQVNLLLILGLSAVITPLAVGAALVRRDIPILLGVSLLVWLVAAVAGSIGPLVGAGLVAALLGYTAWLIVQSRREGAAAADPAVEAPRPLRWPVALVLLLVGLGLLVLGAGWLVDGAAAIARAWGISELVIGLTVVAVGTSFPELATSIVAALRGQRDIAIGNVVGSNLFNLLGVLGAAGLVGGGLRVPPAVLAFDLPLMAGATLLCWPLCRSGFTLNRVEGGYLVLGYLLYTAALVLSAAGGDAAGDSTAASISTWATWGWLALGLAATPWLVRGLRAEPGL